jgi:hypothetical protein
VGWVGFVDEGAEVDDVEQAARARPAEARATSDVISRPGLPAESPFWAASASPRGFGPLSSVPTEVVCRVTLGAWSRSLGGTIRL